MILKQVHIQARANRLDNCGFTSNSDFLDPLLWIAPSSDGYSSPVRDHVTKERYVLFVQGIITRQDLPQSAVVAVRR